MNGQCATTGAIRNEDATRRASPYPRSLRQLACRAVLVAGDALTFLLALQLAILVRNRVLSPLFPMLPGPRFSLRDYAGLWWMIVLFIVFIGMEGLYIRRRTFWDEVQMLWKVTTLCGLAIFAVVAMGKLSASVSRLILLMNWLWLLLLVPLTRLLIKKILFRCGLWRIDVLILGAGRTGLSILQAFMGEPMLGYRIIGFLDDDPEMEGRAVDDHHGGTIPVMGPLSRAIPLIKGGAAQEVVIAIPSMPESQLLDLVGDLQRYVSSIRVIPGISSLPMMSLEVDHFLQARIFTVQIPYNLSNPWNLAVKRVFDVIVSVILIVVTLPIMILLAFLIRSDSQGPAIHRRRVVGRNGKSFQIFKFRTMVANADEVLKKLLAEDARLRQEHDRHFKLANDPRITPIGGILRKSSLDELPQLFNVLGGSMSLVGPRPVLQQEIERYYGPHADWYFAVKPGLTGLWQVSGRSDVDYQERVALDVWYIRNWSLWLDAVILIRTFRAVLTAHGAH